MGVFWHVAVLKKQSRVDVQEVLKELAAGENEFELELSACSAVECDAGVIIWFNDFCLAFDMLAKALSEKLKVLYWCAISMMMTTGIIFYIRMAESLTSL